MANNKLSNQELKYFYDLLFRYETEICENKTGYRIKDKELTKFLKGKNVKLKYKNVDKIQEHDEKNTIYFTSNTSVCFDFIRHVRNSFAHCLLLKEKNNYIIQDKYKKKYTMYGMIGQNLLKELIEKMESSKK